MRRTLLAAALTLGTVVLSAAATCGTAAAQGPAIGGRGNHYFLAGAGNDTGLAVEDFRFGDPGDDAYIGDLVDEHGDYGADGQDDLVVRRGNQFIVRGPDGRAAQTFRYGDPGDQVYLGDWNRTGVDLVAVRRGNSFQYQDAPGSGRSGGGPVFGDRGDQVLVADFAGLQPGADGDLYGNQTLVARRGNHFFVKDVNLMRTAYDFHFGDPGDEVLVGDWATPPVFEPDYTPGRSGDTREELVVRRGNVFYVSADVRLSVTRNGFPLGTARTMAFGDPGDTVFVAQASVAYDQPDGTEDTLDGDGLAVRRND